MVAETVLGGAIGALASTVVVKRVKEIVQEVVGAGKHENVILAVCVSSSCSVKVVAVDGSSHEITMLQGEIVMGIKSVEVVSGQVFLVRYTEQGVL